MKNILLIAAVSLALTATGQEKTVTSAGPDKNKIFTYVDEMPVFPGSIGDYISENLKYPDSARLNNIEGRVVVRFVVRTTGQVDDVKVTRGIGGGCDEEAARVVRAMPKWKPGRQNGELVNVYYNLPLNFVLEAPLRGPVKPPDMDNK